MTEQTNGKTLYEVAAPRSEQVTLVGRVGRDAEMRYTQTGKPVTSISLAVSRAYQKDGTWVEQTAWYKFAFWGEELAVRAAGAIKKGQIVSVTYNPSDLKANAYLTKEGKPAASLEVNGLRYRIVASPVGTEMAPEGPAVEDTEEIEF